MIKRGKGQSWSFDLVLAFVVFILIIGILYALLSHKKTDRVAELELEAASLTSNLDAQTAINPQLALIDKGTIDPVRLDALASKDYESLKQDLGLRGDFCIYLVDYNGNILPINGTVGYGNGNLTINSISCGNALPP